MSKADILIIEANKREVQKQMKDIIREGTSNGNNRHEYQKLKKRLIRINKWLKELKN